MAPSSNDDPTKLPPTSNAPDKPGPKLEGSELLRKVRESAEDFRAFLDELEAGLNESLKNDPPKKRAPKSK